MKLWQCGILGVDVKNGNYKMKSGIVYTCFSTDFLIEEADEWRKDC